MSLTTIILAAGKSTRMLSLKSKILFKISGLPIIEHVYNTSKKLSNDNPFLTLTFSGLVGAIIISIFVPIVWISPSYQQWIIMISIAFVGTIGHFFLILSLKFADASKLAPLGYFEIVNNIIIGYYFFNDFPDKWIWLGLIIIISSGVYISFRENINKKNIVTNTIH